MGSALAWLTSGILAIAVYTNVIADDSAVREQADAVARRYAGCGDHCPVMHMQGLRSVVEYRADYQIEGFGKVRVTCQRSALVVGDHACRAE